MKEYTENFTDKMENIAPPPREYKYFDIYIGMKESFERIVTKDMEDKFREISGDNNPLHYDDNFAQEISKGKYKKHVTFGMLTAGLYSTVAGMYLPGKYSLIHSFDEISFVKPVFEGDKLTVTAEVTDKNDSLKLIVLKICIKNQENKTVSKAKMKVIVME